MKNASSILNKYVSPDGLKFEFEEDEQILVDSFEFWSVSKTLAYIAFITNKRFIFKVITTVGRNKVSIKLINADLCFINWRDVKEIYYEKRCIRIIGDGSKLIKEFTPEGKSTGWEKGLIGIGFGELSYADEKKLEQDFLISLRKISEENNLDFGTSKEYSQFSLIDQEQAMKIKKKVDDYDRSDFLLSIVLGLSIVFIPIVLIRACSG